MKAKFLLVLCAFVIKTKLSAQDSTLNSQNDIRATTGIYDFDWIIDPELVNQTTFNNPNDRIQGNGFNRLFISQALFDSTVRAVEKLVGEKVPSTAKCVYRTNRYGRQVATKNTIQTIGGLPSSCRKKAILAFERDYYADVHLRIGSTKGRILGDVSGTNVTTLRPNVALKIKVYNQEKQRVYRNWVRLRNFKGITRMQIAINGINMSNRNALTQEQIAEMVFMAIEALRNK